MSESGRQTTTSTGGDMSGSRQGFPARLDWLLLAVIVVSLVATGYLLGAA